jgi:hypothetical protein
MAAVLVLLSGGPSARAGVFSLTVRCVPSHTINSSCYVPVTEYTTIQAAVAAASAFDIILVAPGTYNETVVIMDETSHARDGLALLGAQAGNDAREDRHNPAEESIVDPQGNGPAITVQANYVLIDGFTIQNGVGELGSGIDLELYCPTTCSAPYPTNGSVIVNNIFKNNDVGVTMNVLEQGILIGVLIEHNLFKNNNAATPPALTGIGIGAAAVDLVTITENAFTGNKTTAMIIFGSDHVTITNNTSKKDGAFVGFQGTENSEFSHNYGEEFGANGVTAFKSHTSNAAVDISYGNNGLVISDNSLEGGNAPIKNGIAFTTAFGTGAANTALYVKNNQIRRFPGNGIVANANMLNQSFILGNEVKDNGANGIFIDISVGNYSNSLFDNEAYHNGKNDCEDDTGLSNPGPGTLGTWNRWFNNTGPVSSPTGLCSPETPHQHY